MAMLSLKSIKLALVVLLALTLASCTASGENSATHTAQIERSIERATRMAAGNQATVQAKGTQIAATAQARQSLLESARQMPLMIYDSFDEDLGLWETGETIDDLGKGWWKITNGRYEWGMEAVEGLVWWISPDMEPVGDFYVSTMAQKLSGSSASLYGLAFRIFDIKHYYVLQINEQQRYSVYAYDYENGWIELIPWSNCAVIDPDQPNQLEIIGIGSLFMFYINGQFINQVSDDLFASGTVGLLTGLDNPGEQGAWAFDDFELRAVPLPAALPAPLPADNTPTP
jgi:hypothetical protein